MARNNYGNSWTLNWLSLENILGTTWKYSDGLSWLTMQSSLSQWYLDTSRSCNWSTHQRRSWLPWEMASQETLSISVVANWKIPKSYHYSTGDICRDLKGFPPQYSFMLETKKFHSWDNIIMEQLIFAKKKVPKLGYSENTNRHPGFSSISCTLKTNKSVAPGCDSIKVITLYEERKHWT